MLTLLASVLVAGASCAGGRNNPPLRVNDIQVKSLADTKQLTPDAVLQGTLTGDDNQTWHLVPFEVPAGTTRITVDFDYTTRDAHTTIDLGLLGPDGFRGQDGF